MDNVHRGYLMGRLPPAKPPVETTIGQRIESDMERIYWDLETKAVHEECLADDQDRHLLQQAEDVLFREQARELAACQEGSSYRFDRRVHCRDSDTEMSERAFEMLQFRTDQDVKRKYGLLDDESTIHPSDAVGEAHIRNVGVREALVILENFERRFWQRQQQQRRIRVDRHGGSSVVSSRPTSDTFEAQRLRRSAHR